MGARGQVGSKGWVGVQGGARFAINGKMHVGVCAALPWAAVVLVVVVRCSAGRAVATACVEHGDVQEELLRWRWRWRAPL